MVEFNFKPRARLLLQLGDELIRNESIAVLELAKNSYDADSSRIAIKMEKSDNQDEGIISIEDDGDGMNLEIIENVWMEPGTSNKLNNKKYTKKFKRKMLGEKGIGRFAAHKLGNVIELTTKKKDNKEVFLKIDWRIFEESKYLTDSSIDIIERQPEVFTEGKTGTKIVIKKLRRSWTREMLRDLYRSWNMMNSPIESNESFKMKFDAGKDNNYWLDKIMKFDELLDYALFKFSCKIKGDKITTFEYNFQPYPTMKKLRSRKITHEDSDIQKILEIAKPTPNGHDVEDNGIGEIEFNGFIFDREPNILSLVTTNKSNLRDYLNENGGIKVYKDGLRVYDYGEKGNDWLNLDVRRINMPATKISNNIIIGFVSISKEKSWDLIEKTNREGFISNLSYKKFMESITYALHLVEGQRNIDKNLIKTYYSSTSHDEPVASTINELKSIVSKKLKDEPIRNEITNKLNKIEKDYNYVNEILLKSAGAGLSLSIILHEVEKIVKELNSMVVNNHYNGIHKLIEHLEKLLDGYTTLIKSSGMKKLNIKKIIKQSLFNVQYRLQQHNIELIVKEDDIAEKSMIRGSESLITSSIMNIIDNSIYWLEYSKIPKKKVLINCSNMYDGYTTIIIADNGVGFSLPTEIMIKPFVSGREDGTGLGLYIVNHVMTMHKGKLFFPNNEDLLIRQEFRSGGIICLMFKVENNI